MLLALGAMVKTSSLELSPTPAALVTPEIVISPPLANGLVFLTLTDTKSLAGV